MNNAVLDEWTSLLAAGTIGQKLLPENRLHLYYGADISGRPVFFLVSMLKSEAPKLADLVRVEHGQRTDGAWTVVLTLTDVEYLDTFMGMCLELSRRTSRAPDEATALQIFDETIWQWRRLLTYKGPRVLSASQIRGLFGELWFLHGLGENGTDPDVAIASWIGPHGAPQDFRLGGGQIHEIKTVRSGANSVHISSLEQLEVDAPEQLTLNVITVNDAPDPGETGTLSLPALLATIRASFNGRGSALDALADKLALLGFDETDETYARSAFIVIGAQQYGVGDGFPRILRSSAPAGVLRTKYEILTAALEPFLTGKSHNPEKPDEKDEQ